MQLRQEWLNRPRNVDLHFCASFCSQLALWWVGLVVYRLSFGYLNPEDGTYKLS